MSPRRASATVLLQRLQPPAKSFARRPRSPRTLVIRGCASVLLSQRVTPRVTTQRTRMALLQKEGVVAGVSTPKGCPMGVRENAVPSPPLCDRAGRVAWCVLNMPAPVQ
jgi:alanine dehydrogenase